MNRVFYAENSAGVHRIDWSGSTEELRVFLDSNPHLIPLKDVPEEKKKAARNNRTRTARAEEYPPAGDALDALAKWVFTEREIGFPDELVSWAASCMSVKSRHQLED
jgi:hypothetical protein